MRWISDLVRGKNAVSTAVGPGTLTWELAPWDWRMSRAPRRPCRSHSAGDAIRPARRTRLSGDPLSGKTRCLRVWAPLPCAFCTVKHGARAFEWNSRGAWVP